MNDKIVDLYFNKKMKQAEIADLLNIAKSTVSKIVRKDSRFITEKEHRKSANKAKHNKNIQKRVEEKRKSTQLKNSVDNLILKNLHTQDSIELSDRKRLTNESYREWNYSAYKYNPSRKRYEFREELGRSNDVPQYIKERI